MEIEYLEKIEEKDFKLIDDEFNEYGKECGVACDFKPFYFVAKEDEKIVGYLTGHSYYKEVHVGDLVVLKEYRHHHIGSQLMKKMEEYFIGKGFEHINLTTYEFQAPEFYKKCGYEVEYIRKDKTEPKLNKYYLIKYL